MTDDDMVLFGDDEAEAPPAPATQQPGLAEWHVTQLRGLLDDLGLTTMAERQAVVAEIAGREVGSLRELTSVEARSVAEQLTERERTGSRTDQRSSWDDRDEDTWIDRL